MISIGLFLFYTSIQNLVSVKESYNDHDYHFVLSFSKSYFLGQLTLKSTEN